MSSMINTNIASLNAQRNLTTSQSSLTTSMQRLSSGLRINSAKDDAAGLAISERLSSQIGGINQAVRNANDGISLAQTAEGDLTQIGSNLQRIRDLAVQSANASNSASDRAALNNEASQLISEIDRVASSSNFNGVSLLNGTFSSQSFQVGANGTSNDQITVASIASAKSSSLGVGAGSSYASKLNGNASTTDALGSGGLVINGATVGATSSDGVSFKDSSGSAIAKAAAINSASGTTGVQATAGVNTVNGTTVTAAGYAAAIATGDIKINGVDLGPIGVAGSAGERGSQVSAAINAKSSQTGVTSTYDATTGAVALAATDGRNITIEKAASATISADDATTGLTTGAVTKKQFSVTYAAQVSLTSTSSKGIQVTNGAEATSTGGQAVISKALAAGDLKINGVDVAAVAANSELSVSGQNIADAINAISNKTGVTASSDTAGALTLKSASGAAFTVTANAAGTTASGFLTATTSFASAAGVGATSAGLSTTAVAATTTVGAGVSSLDLTTASGATAALSTIDSALQSINTSRASLGAYQNRFASAVSSLQTTGENLTASRSRIRDADFAQETANLTRGQVLQQAGTAILAQANALPQGVLALLR